jgi:hypothetical protein
MPRRLWLTQPTARDRPGWATVAVGAQRDTRGSAFLWSCPFGRLLRVVDRRVFNGREPLVNGSLTVHRRLPLCATVRREALLRVGGDPNLGP